MKYFLCILLVISVCGEHVKSEISISSAEKLVDEKVAEVISDQSSASGNVNTNNYNEGYIGLSNDYRGGFGNYFGKDIEKFSFDKKFGDTEKFERSQENRYFGYDDGNPDIHGRIQRPCQAYDLFCIRKFFAEHSQCKISGRQVPEPLYRAQATLNVPSSNISATLINTEYKGIKDGRVEEFYIDKVTDNLVLTLDFDSVSFTTDCFLKYYFPGREPIVTRDDSIDAFLKVSVTVVIPKVKDLNLERAEIFTSTSEPIPVVIGGPRLGISTDPEVPLRFAQFLANGPLYARESLLTEGAFYAANFIQYNICDFGLKVL